jgi:UDP-N-acetylmuramate dehydrogenase
MSDYTTFRVGGNVDALYEANSVENLQRVLRYLNEDHIPCFVVGLGSNLLVKDEGLEGLVILLRGPLADIEQEGTDDLTILAGGGLSIVDLLAYCRALGLGGLEFLAGIPGTIGGVVAMNAGAFGREIGEKIETIHIITQQGDVVVRDRSKLNFSYRKLDIEEGAVIIQVRLELDREDKGVVGELIGNYLRRRKESQPLEYPSAGSVFKNPPHDYAGRLIEKAGLKGKMIGGAMISERHCNFIINTGGAKAKDVLALLNLAQEKVRKKTGIELQPEIKVVGY